MYRIYILFILLFYCFTFKVALSDEIITVASHEIESRRLVEDNGIADTLCRFVNILTSDITKVILGFSLFSLGIATYLGKLTIGGFLSIWFGSSILFIALPVLGFLLPYSDVAEGCKCKSTLIVGRKANGEYIRILTNLDPDCNVITAP